MRPISWLLAASAATLLAGAAAAQDMNQGSSPPPAPPSADAPPPPAPDTSAPTAPMGSPDHPIPQSSPTPADQAFHLKAGDPNVVSNAPVPDTPQNRAAYGQPMSRTGKHTKPAGN